jgi:hypothetical protein
MSIHRKNEDVRARAFAAGTQPEVGQGDALKELEADFERKRVAARQRATDGIKTLEAKEAVSGDRKTEAGERWARMSELTGGRDPEFAKPSIATVTAFALILAEGKLLAPTMDGLNVTEPGAQWAVATVLVLALSGLLKWSVHSFRQTPRRLWMVVAPAAFSLTALAVFGWWRGEEVVFAGLQEAEVNTFAAQNAALTKLLLMLVTIALPALAAVALEFGLEKLRFWWEHRKARGDFFRFNKEHEGDLKRLEAAREGRDHELEKLAQDREAWLAAARDSFELGRKVGAHKRPAWEVALHIAVAAVLIFVGVTVVAFLFIDSPLSAFIESGPIRFALFLLTALGLTGLAAARIIRRWHRPTPEELWAGRPTHWRNADSPDAVRLHDGAGSTTGVPGAARPAPGLPSRNNDAWDEETVVTAR